MTVKHRKTGKRKSLSQNLESLFLAERQIEKQNAQLQVLFKSLFLVKNRWKNVLYIDTPFCRQRCRFCRYFKLVPKNSAEISNFYNKILDNQIREYHEILKKTKFNEVAFGGGTPTIAGTRTLEKLFKRIPNFEKIRLKIIESSPEALTERHIELFKKYNFTTISIGVQTFSQNLLRKQGRVSLDLRRLEYFCRKIERYGMISNIDLILFLDETGGVDLFQERQDLEYDLSELRPVEIVLHTRYSSKRTSKEHRAAVNLIKEMLKKYPEYICINSLLQRNEAVNQAYRLMRKSLGYTFYLQSVTPLPGNYGYNILPLGYYEGLYLCASFYNLHFEITTKPFFKLFSKDKFWLEKHRHYKAFANTRKKLGLSYEEFDKKHFFVDKTGENEFQRISKQIRKISKVLNGLYLDSKILRKKIKEGIKSCNRSKVPLSFSECKNNIL
jgi:radical SAM superfamily enzyme